MFCFIRSELCSVILKIFWRDAFNCRCPNFYFNTQLFFLTLVTLRQLCLKAIFWSTISEPLNESRYLSAMISSYSNMSDCLRSKILFNRSPLSFILSCHFLRIMLRFGKRFPKWRICGMKLSLTRRGTVTAITFAKCQFPSKVRDVTAALNHFPEGRARVCTPRDVKIFVRRKDQGIWRKWNGGVVLLTYEYFL